MGRVVAVGPVRGENLVGLAAKQEGEFLLEHGVELFAERLIEIGHLPAAELEALGWILGRPAGRLHDAIHGNHGADDNLPHGSLSLLNRLAWFIDLGDRKLCLPLPARSGRLTFPWSTGAMSTPFENLHLRGI